LLNKFIMFAAIIWGVDFWEELLMAGAPASHIAEKNIDFFVKKHQTAQRAFLRCIVHNINEGWHKPSPTSGRVLGT
jgi:hypothetical protein